MHGVEGNGGGVAVMEAGRPATGGRTYLELLNFIVIASSSTRQPAAAEIFGFDYRSTFVYI